MISSWPNSDTMNRRFVPSPACVIATGRRGFRFGNARAVFSGSGEVSTGSAANTELADSARRTKTTAAEMDLKSKRIVIPKKGGLWKAKGRQLRDRYNNWQPWPSLLPVGIQNCDE